MIDENRARYEVAVDMAAAMTLVTARKHLDAIRAGAALGIPPEAVTREIEQLGEAYAAHQRAKEPPHA